MYKRAFHHLHPPRIKNAEFTRSVCSVCLLQADFKQYLHFPAFFNKISGATKVLSISTRKTVMKNKVNEKDFYIWMDKLRIW